MVALRLVADAVLELLKDGNIPGAVWTYLYGIMGPLLPGGICFGLSAALYIRTQDLAYVAAVWLIVGSALMSSLAGTDIAIGRVLFIIGVSVMAIRVWLGRETYG